MADFPTPEEWERFLDKVSDAFRELRGVGSMTEVKWSAGISQDDAVQIHLSIGDTQVISKRDWQPF